jgi:uncharacterized protein (DUF924 family)
MNGASDRNPASDPQAARVLAFWFGAADDPARDRPRAVWFKKDPAFDARVLESFSETIALALEGGLAHWALEPAGALARIIVLDQFTRNAFRDTARAFSGDTLALAAARELVGSGGDHALTGVQRQFAYLPFEHAEDLRMQQESMRLFDRLARDEPTLADLLTWAQRHYAIIERFGRFPHRNALLGRDSTPQEMEFLRQPGSGF